MLKTRAYYITGFTLIEVLISMIILAFGLLGLAAMQALALKDNQDMYFYSQANLLAYEMSDRIKANPVYWKERADGELNDVPDAEQGNGCNSSGSPCTPADLASYDMYYWQENVRRVLPAPSTGDAVMIERSPCLSIAGVQGTKHRSVLCLIIRWSRTNQRLNTGMLPDTTYKLELTP